MQSWFDFDNSVVYIGNIITTQRISPASAGGGFYLSAQSEYNLRLFGQRFYESPLLVKSRALKKISKTLNQNKLNVKDLPNEKLYPMKDKKIRIRLGME